MKELKVWQQENGFRSELNHLRCDLEAKNHTLSQIVTELVELTQQKQEPATYPVLIKGQPSTQHKAGGSISTKLKQALMTKIKKIVHQL